MNGETKELFKSCVVENSIIVEENLVSYFPARAYNSIDDLEEMIVNPGYFVLTRWSTPLKKIWTLLIMKPYTFTLILSYQI